MSLPSAGMDSFLKEGGIERHTDIFGLSSTGW
jgi:hypothetical protein